MESHPPDLFTRKLPFCSLFKASVVIPTFNSAQNIAATLESLLAQRNCRMEIVVVDANSTDRTLDIVNGYADSRVRVQQVPVTNVFEMINRGIAMAQGEYINILRAGDTYMYPNAISLAMWQIAQHQFPDLFYTASFMRDEWYVSHFLFRPLQAELLRQGLQPTNLQSCWVKRSVFKKIGLFDTSLIIRGAFDFFARFAQASGLRAASEMRAYVDPAIISFTSPYLLRSFRETFMQIRKHYGFGWAFLWLWRQNYLRRMLHTIARRCKWAFSGK